jgi:hypothetical protein
MKIDKFTKQFRDQGYDRKNNPKRLPIKELLPIGVTWFVGNKQVKITFHNYGIVCLLFDMSGIAVVEFHDSTAGKTKAYILNADGTTRFKIRPPTEMLANSHFYDVYYINKDLCFLFYVDGEDMRMAINDSNGTIISVQKTR